MIQSFKNITIIMEHKTNTGMSDGSHVTVAQGGSQSAASLIKDIEAFRVGDDLRFTPVVLDAKGLGFALAKTVAKHGGEETLPLSAVIGILMESFDKPLHEHEVMIHGIISMKADGVVKPGNPVYWNETAKKVTGTVPAAAGKGVYYIGLALTEAAKDNDYIDVLIGK